MRIAGIAACLVLAGCGRENAPNRPPHVSVAADSAEGAPRPSAPVASRTASSGLDDGGAVDDGASAGDAQAAFAVAPVLDRARGARAVQAYHEFHSSFCRALGDAGASAPQLKEDVGIGVDTDDLMFCPGPADGVRAIASGSFAQPGADEVLLEVPSGQARAEGEFALALLRAEGGRYRLVRHTVLNNGFDAKLRVASRDGAEALDVLMLCSRSGAQGVYASACGFWGQGTYAEGSTGDEDDDPNEIPLVAVTACGPAVAEEIGDFALRGDRISVGVVVARSVREASTPEEAASGDCSRETKKSAKRYTLTYEIAARPGRGKPRVRLLTPVPREVREIAKRY